MDHLSLLLCSLFILTSLQSIHGSIDSHIENVQIIPLKVQEYGLSLVPTRCRCIKFIQQIHPKHIGDFEVTAPDSSCQLPEVMYDRLFFAMEYLSGGDLYDYLDKNGRLDLSTTTDETANLNEESSSDCSVTFPKQHEQNVLNCCSHQRHISGVLMYLHRPRVPLLSVVPVSYNGLTHDRIVFALGTALLRLLLKEPAMRLGRKGLIRSHSFFQSIDWEELEAGRVEPPFTLSTFVQKARLGAGPGRRAERQPSELAPAMGRINIRK
ncbi:kinase C theta type [Pelobates cultripes]|uniref:Kinase C theta type n=1 Tax=Pelobates cultripes TaxID=61616 RepID=A0AAD1T8Q3_PELCU|nr:kinase C theta type [Pelobates cultripes]